MYEKRMMLMGWGKECGYLNDYEWVSVRDAAAVECLLGKSTVRSVENRETGWDEGEAWEANNE